jgi:hypothetical protein
LSFAIAAAIGATAVASCHCRARAVELRVATFVVDVTPPVGAPLCLGLVPRTTGVDDPLSARGVVLMAEGEAPVVLVAVDWVGIANESHVRWRRAIADACGTTPDRVAVQTLHQHDAPGCDMGAEAIAAGAGFGGELIDRNFSLNAVDQVAKGAERSLESAKLATHMAYGVGVVERVASNRRILGPDGKVAYQRMSSAGDRTLRELAEGTIDPQARAISFWDGDRPLAVLTYYATHPQSYYRTGKASADFVGMARSAREAAVAGVVHIHFNGASGNVAAGKYNDGNPARRAELAERLAAGLERAWRNSRRLPLRNLAFDWKTLEVRLPLASWMQRPELEQLLAARDATLVDRSLAARTLSYLDRYEAQPIVLSRLRIGPVDLLHLPGEPFVEYQLAAQQVCPGQFVCVAAYGDYGPGYIGLHRSYAEGGYETGRTSRVSPQVETTLTEAIQELGR